MTIAERLVEEYNNSNYVGEVHNTLVRRQIRKWKISWEISLFTDENEEGKESTVSVEVFQFEDGSLAIVPDKGNAATIDPSFPASERLL